MTKEEVIRSFPAEPTSNLAEIIGSIGALTVIILLILWVVRNFWGFPNKSIFKTLYLWILVAAATALITTAGLGMVISGSQKTEVELARINWTEHVFLPYAMNADVSKIPIKDTDLFGDGSVGLMLTNNKYYDVEFSSAIKFYETDDADDKGYAMVRQLDLSEFPEESNAQNFWLPEVVSVHLAYVPSNSAAALENNKE